MFHVKLITVYILLLLTVIYTSKFFQWTDNPNERKIHIKPTINTGGLIIYFFYLFVISQREYNHNIELIISIGFFIALGGFIDDRINLRPLSKILFILIPSIFLIYNGFSIQDLGKYEHVGMINLGKFEIPFIILAIGLLVNATNYIDGIDGFLLSFFITCITYYIFIINDKDTINLLIIFLIPLFLNLLLNLFPSGSNFKLFNGDAGSLFFGFFLCFITIDLYKSFEIHPVYLIWPLWYPVYDFLHVNINRILNKKSIFVPDRSHFHQYIFYKFKKNHFISLIVLNILNISVIIFGYLVSNFSKLISLILFILSFFIYSWIRKLLK